jgi:DNA-binding NtrC family response regulator
MAPDAKVVLVAEDDPSLLVFADRYLRRAGLSVIPCRGPRDAWTKFSAHPGIPTLALIDMAMREEPGDQLAARMLELNPALRLLFWSGYPFDVARFVASRPSPVRAEFLLKPFAPAALLAAVNRLLAA